MHKVKSVNTKDNYVLQAVFHDGKVVIYDMKPLFAVIPAFRVLQSDKELFQSVKISQNGDMIFWSENLNLDAETVWENGIIVEVSKKPSINHLLAYKLHMAREQAGMTQKELAEKTGIYQADISKLERGLGNPSLGTLSRLAEGLNMELNVDFYSQIAEGHQDMLDGNVSTIDEVREEMRKRWEERG